MAAAAFAYRSKNDSSSDSDSDNSDRECQDWKRASRRTEKIQEKIPIDQPQTPNDSPQMSTDQSQMPNDQNAAKTKRKRNNIWCEVMEDQLLSESLDHCGVKQLPKDYGNRGEESYDYTLARKFHRKDKSRDQDDDEDAMSDSTEASSVVSGYRPRNFHNRRVEGLDSAGKETAMKIIKILAEQKTYLIFRIVKFLGIEKAMKLLKMTEEIESNGGMMIKNNSRRRTPGGVYFQLLRSDMEIEKSVMDKIFEGEMNSFESKRLFEERKKLKKKRKQAEKACLKATELPLPITFPPSQKKLEEVTKMEENGWTVMEEDQPVAAASVSEMADIKSNDSDLEDGEIDD